MQQFGLGNYLYTLDVQDGNANFKFVDPDDAYNTAEVSVAQKDFPEGAPANSRQVADLAYAQCSKVLNDKRDARLRKQAADELDAKQKEDSRAREAGEDFLQNAQDLQQNLPTTTPDSSAEKPRDDAKPDNKKK